MKIEIPDFAYGEHIPFQFTKYGENQRPDVQIKEVPAHARSLALIMDDPDAPKGTFTHWVAFNLLPSTHQIEGNEVITDGLEGQNDWNETAYGGPRPPDGEHRYYFRLYALDRVLELPEGITRSTLEEAMRGHVIAKAEWMGRFSTPVQAERDAG